MDAVVADGELELRLLNKIASIRAAAEILEDFEALSSHERRPFVTAIRDDVGCLQNGILALAAAPGGAPQGAATALPTRCCIGGTQDVLYEEICKNAEDPAVQAAKDASDAERAFLGIPTESFLDELRSEFRDAEALWHDAEDDFADAVPTTPLGMMAKLRELARLLRYLELSGDSLEVRHVHALITYVRYLLQQPVN